MTAQAATKYSPAWLRRYKDDPFALQCLVACHRREALEDPANADWYLTEAAEINAYLRRYHP